MIKVLYQGELYRGGLLTTVDVFEHERDLIEVVLKSQLATEDGKKMIVDNNYKMFFTNREFEEFFKPFLYEMKERFDNADSIQQ
jgi:hypothetical protein